MRKKMQYSKSLKNVFNKRKPWKPQTFGGGVIKDNKTLSVPMFTDLKMLAWQHCKPIFRITVIPRKIPASPWVFIYLGRVLQPCKYSHTSFISQQQQVRGCMIKRHCGRLRLCMAWFTCYEFTFHICQDASYRRSFRWAMQDHTELSVKGGAQSQAFQVKTALPLR